MDSNVSKDTFSHKFFKLKFTNKSVQQQNTISVQNLLIQELLKTLDIYQQELNTTADLKLVFLACGRKIMLFQPVYRQLSAKKQSQRNFSSSILQSKFTPVIYSSPIAFSLAAHLQLQPQKIATDLADLLAAILPNTPKALTEFRLKSKVEVHSSGWLNFYLEPLAIATWLEQSLALLSRQASTPQTNYQLGQTADHLFAIQYVHARCCSLLHLAARAKLITLKDNQFKSLQIEPLQSLSWLDPKQSLWLDQEAEFALLGELFIVADCFVCPPDNWLKTAWEISVTVEIFQTKCRFLGEVSRQTPPKAIARLGLIALAQYWLQRILIEKLNVAAPVSL